jgi:ABC-type nitrate/sulfonate/bicarbonate transport system substrate-binding protein
MRLVLGLVSLTATYWLHYVAQARGLYAAEGLEVEPAATRTTGGGVAALEAGQVDVASNCPDYVVASVERGAALAIVGGVVLRPVSAVVARPDVKQVGDLRGRRVAVTEQVGGVSSLLKAILRRHGLGPGDYELSIIGGTPAQAEALRAGRADAAMLTHPFEARLLAEGYTLLGYTSDYWPEYAFTTLNVRRDWAAANGPALEALLRATIHAGRWLFDPANAAAAQEILAAATSLPTDEVADTYRLYVQEGGVLSREGELSEPSVQAVLDVMREENLLGDASPLDRFLDLSYWQRARAAVPGQGGASAAGGS